MKIILSLMAAMAVMLLSAAPMHAAGLGNPEILSLNATNAIPADRTNSYTTVSASTQTAKDLAIQIRFKLLSGAETGTVTFKFAKSVDGTNPEDTPFFQWDIPANGTNYVSQCTNLTVNAIPKVFLTSVTTTNDVAMTNIAITVFRK